jgi:hypothetical protein
MSTTSIPAEQLDAYDKDFSECSEGLVPDIDEFTDADWNTAYQMVIDAVNCLAGIGVTVPEVPSLQEYRDDHGGWSVYQELINTGVIKPGDVETLSRKCPQPDFWPSG